jgi:hypothetical protein
MLNSPAIGGKNEIDYQKLCKKYHDYVVNAHADSVHQGFVELLSSPHNRSGALWRNTKIILERLKRMRIFLKYSKKLRKGMKECFSDLDPYFAAMAEGTWVTPVDSPELHEELWQKFKEYALSEWGIVKIGFTMVRPS